MPTVRPIGPSLFIGTFVWDSGMRRNQILCVLGIYIHGIRFSCGDLIALLTISYLGSQGGIFGPMGYTIGDGSSLPHTP